MLLSGEVPSFIKSVSLSQSLSSEAQVWMPLREDMRSLMIFNNVSTVLESAGLRIATAIMVVSVGTDAI